MNGQLLTQFGQVVKDARRTRRMEISQLADSAGISVNDVQMIERGNFDPTLTQMQMIALALDIQLSDFIGR